MKKIISLFLLGILNICPALFAMQSDEQRTQRMLQIAQDLINQLDDYEGAVRYLNQFNALKKTESDLFAQAAKKLEQFMAQEVLNKVQPLINQHKYKEVYDELDKLKKLKIKGVDPLAQTIKDLTKLLVQEGLKDIQQFISQHEYKKAHDILNQFLKLQIPASDPLAVQIKSAGNLLIQEELKDAQQLVSEGKYQEAYNMLSGFRFLFLARGYDKGVADKLEQALIQAVKNAELLVAQEQLKDAYDVLNKFKALNISENTFILLAAEIKKLEKLLQEAGLKKAQVDLKAAEDYAKQNTEDGYKKAYEILNKLKEMKIAKAAVLEIQIRQQEAAWKKTQIPATVLPEQQKWLFIKQMPSSTQERIDPKSDWNVTKKEELMLNLDAQDTVTLEPFANLIKQAQDNQLPFILVMLKSGDRTKFFPHFFSVDVLISLMQKWKSTNQLENPKNREEVFNIEIYVMGDDGVLRLLKVLHLKYEKDKAKKVEEVDKVAKYLENFVDYKGYTDDPTTGRRTHNYKLKPELEEPGKPGIAQALIADLYKKQETAAKPELQQLERLWLSWALPKFSAADSAQKEQATQRLNAIPNKPELIPAHKQVEQEHLARETEEAKKAEEARKAQEAEKIRQAEQAKLKQEQARLAREAETAQRAEAARKAQEAEDLRKAQEAERLRQAEQEKLKQEQERLAQEVEAARKNKEAEKLRQAQEEQARLKQEQEKLARETETAKKAEEARKAQAAEDLRKAQEAEKVRQAEQARLKQEQERLTREAGVVQTKIPQALLSALHNFSTKLGQFVQELR